MLVSDRLYNFDISQSQSEYLFCKEKTVHLPFYIIYYGLKKGLVKK